MKKLWLILWLAPFLHAQGNMCHNAQGFQMCTNYALSTPLITTQDNVPNAKTMNVWHTMAGAPANLAGVTSGLDAAGNMIHYFWTTTGAAWQWHDYFDPTTPNTWTQLSAMGTDNYQLAAGNNMLWKLTLSHGNCAAYNEPTGHVTEQWNGSAWITPAHIACAKQMSISLTDNTLYVVNADTGSTASVYNGTAFASIQGGPYWSVTAIDSCTALLTTPGDHNIWQRYNCNGTAVQLWFVTAPQNNMLIADGGTWLEGANGQIYKMNQNATYDLLVAPSGTGSSYPPSMDSCGFLCTFVVKSGALYMFPDVQLNASLQLTGNTTCTPNCPGGTVHTPTLKAKFKNSLAGGQTVTGPAVPPTTNVNLQAQDSTWDLLSCFEDNFSCFTTSGGGASEGDIFCSALATNIFQQAPSGGNPTAWVNAVSRAGGDSETNCSSGNPTLQCGMTARCVYNGAFDWVCDQGMNPNPHADYLMSAMTVCRTDGLNPPGPDPKVWGADIGGKCYYWAPLPSSPLLCLHDPFPGTVGYGPWYKKVLDTDHVPVDTPGKCTIQGVTN